MIHLCPGGRGLGGGQSRLHPLGIIWLGMQTGKVQGGGMETLMCCMANRSKHFMGVNATDQQSLKQDEASFFGTGMLVVLKHDGTACLRKVLKILKMCT